MKEVKERYYIKVSGWHLSKQLIKIIMTKRLIGKV